jgi:hypothetical protein
MCTATRFGGLRVSVSVLRAVCAFAARGMARMARKPMAHARVIIVMTLPLLLEGRPVTDVRSISGL